MKVENNNLINFGIKLNSVEVLEVASVTILQSNGIEGVKNVATKISGKPLKFPGHQGYRHFAEVYGPKICAKYPNIAEIARQIQEIKANNPFIRKNELYQQVKPMIDKLGNEIDIEI